MSDYEIGKDVNDLAKRLEVLESHVSDLLEFSCSCHNEFTEPSVVRETVPADEEDELLREAGVTSVRYIWTEDRECHAMIHYGSWLRIWSNGAWQSSCNLKDRSQHSKWQNWVQFTIPDAGVDLGLAWLGNFGPGETKTYPGRGSSAALAANYREIVDKHYKASRFWRCYRR